MKKETLEEVAEKSMKNAYGYNTYKPYYNFGFKRGVKWQQQNSYTEEDIAKAFNEGQAYSVTGKLIDGKEWVKTHGKEWFNK